MTEIKIERKERRSVWPWLLGVAALLLLLFLLRSRGNDEVAGDTRADSVITNTSTGTVAGDTAGTGGGARRP